MKTFDELFTELTGKAAYREEGSRTAELLEAGTHAIAKKVVEEAYEAGMAAEHEGKERTADEIAQLLYHVQCLMLSADVSLDDVYHRL